MQELKTKDSENDELLKREYSKAWTSKFATACKQQVKIQRADTTTSALVPCETLTVLYSIGPMPDLGMDAHIFPEKNVRKSRFLML